MIYYAFDLHPRLDPLGARLVRFTNLQASSYKAEANGTGRGSLSIRATDAEAAFIDPNGLQYVRVVEINDAVLDGATLSGFGETVRGGFFLESGTYEVLTETSTKLLTWGGLGALSYYGRAVMDADSWLTDPFIGTDPQPDGTWPLHLAGTGNELGAILWRVLRELMEAGRWQNPVPAMTLGFTYLVDSNAAAWVRTTGDFVAQVGDNVLDIIRRLMQMGLYVEVDSDTFEVNAYEPETHRRDRTGVAWGASVVRLQSPTDSTVSTGNIKSDAYRQLEAKVRRNAELIGSNDSWLWVSDPAVDVLWEGSFSVDDEAGTSLLKVGEARLSARSDAGDVLRARIKLGDDPSNGRYVPFDHIRLDDLVTVGTGSGTWDYDEAEFPVAAIALELRPGGDWDAWAELGSTFLSPNQRAFQAQPVGAHTHPPNPKLCVPSRGWTLPIEFLIKQRFDVGAGDGPTRIFAIRHRDGIVLPLMQCTWTYNTGTGDMDLSVIGTDDASNTTGFDNAGSVVLAADGVDFFTRFRIEAATVMARCWADGDVEPGAWQASATGGGFGLTALEVSTINRLEDAFISQFPDPSTISQDTLTIVSGFGTGAVSDTFTTAVAAGSGHWGASQINGNQWTLPGSITAEVAGGEAIWSAALTETSFSSQLIIPGDECESHIGLVCSMGTSTFAARCDHVHTADAADVSYSGTADGDTVEEALDSLVLLAANTSFVSIAKWGTD